MKSRQLWQALGLLAVAAAAVLFTVRSLRPPQANLKPSHAIGTVLVEETTRLAGKSARIVILSRSPDSGDTADAARLSAFQTAIQEHPGLKLLATEIIQRPAGHVMDSGGVAPEQLQHALESHRDVNTVVLLAGFPILTTDQLGQLAGSGVKFIVVSGYSSNLRRALEARAVSLAVVPRFEDTPQTAAAPKTARDWFDREYQVFTPETVSALPY